MSDVARPPFYLQEWIDTLGLTDEAVAEASGISRTHVTQLKLRKRDWNERVLAKLAKGMGLKDPLALLRPPNAAAQPAEIWDRIPDARRNQAERAVRHVLEGFAEPASETAPDAVPARKKPR